MLGTFQSGKEIEQLTISLSRMLSHWGLAPKDWMLGKYLFLYHLGLFHPTEVTKEATIYVRKEKLPWRVREKSRTIVPPSGTKYFREFTALQERFDTGIDFYPLPDEQLKVGFISRSPNYMEIGGQRVNVESIKKFVWQQRDIERRYGKKTVAQFRDFYFADKERFEARDRFNKKVLEKIKKTGDKKLAKPWSEVVNGYQKLMRRAYPELFSTRSLSSAKPGVLRGKVVYGEGTLAGEVFAYEQGEKFSKIKGKKIFIFRHFAPVHIQFLKKAKAIITEGGGLLSHAAIVCREAKIPCLVDVAGATRVLKSGQRIEVDFNQGFVKIKD